MIRIKFKYQDPEFYSILFVGPEEGPFEVPPRRIKTYKKSVPDAPKLYFYRKIRVFVCSVHCNLHFYFIGNTISADHVKYETTPLLRANYRLKMSQDV